MPEASRPTGWESGAGDATVREAGFPVGAHVVLSSVAASDFHWSGSGNAGPDHGQLTALA